MPLKAYVINLEGDRLPIEPANGSDFTLNELYAAIGDGCECITIHRLESERLMIVDDDGYSKNKPTNVVATMLAATARFAMAERGIVRNVVICADDQIK